MMLSVIIPAKNEQRYLQRLLESLKQQSLQPSQIIIADAQSKDKTISLAKRYGCAIVKGGFPSVGRNRGASIAKGKWLLFLDADTLLINKGFLKNMIAYLQKKEIDLALFDNIPVYKENEKGYASRMIRIADALIYFFHNTAQKVFSATPFPFGTGTGIVCSNALFKKTQFDERIEAFEDCDFITRASWHGKLRVIPRTLCSLGVSTRRYDKKGRIFFPVKIAFAGLIGRFLVGRSCGRGYFKNAKS
ncbi:glycosyltransferase [Candidatus Woesearchaeota archaeon]|nr:MAG: glycosyltransferase [Candidatus Woesearchaeota archaeon]